MLSWRNSIGFCCASSEAQTLEPMYCHASFICADLAEVRKLLDLATRPHVRAMLQHQLDSVAGAPVAAAAATATESAVSPAQAPPAAGATPTPVAKSTISSNREPEFHAVKGWGWEQPSGTQYVEVTIFEGLEGVGALPAGAVSCEFKTSSFDLTVMGLRGKNYRLKVTNLDKVRGVPGLALSCLV